MSGTSKLRWAQYDGVYQAALHIPAEEIAEVEVPEGHSAVYLLGLDSTVMVPDADLAPYDLTDTAKASHPAAALGVATAQQILEGFGGADGGAEGPSDTLLVEDDYEDDDVPYAQQQQQTQQQTQQRSSGDALQDLSAPDDDGDDDADAEERRHRRREEKRLRKEEKKAAKEARKAAKAAVKRERDDGTVSAPLRRRRRGEDSDDDDDEDASAEDDGEALVAAAASIEGKYKEKKAGKGKPEQEDNAWAAMEADLFSEEEDDGDEGAAGHAGRGAQAALAASRAPLRGLRHGNRMGQALAALNATSAMPDSVGFASSCPYAAPYLMEIHYEYDKLAQEATASGMLLTKQEAELVRELDDELRRKAAEQGYLRSVLAARDSATDKSPEDAAAADALAEAITKLEAPTSIAGAVHRLLAKQLPASAGAFDRAAASRARRAVNRRTRTFQDTSVMTLLEQLRAAAAAPREDGAEVMRRYLLQRRQHEDTKSNLRGLSKTGFYAVPKPMEKWKRGRDMMLLAGSSAEAQTVRPTSYISQTYSVMRQRMKDHAEKRFDRVTISAGNGSSFLNTSSFGAAAALMSSSTDGLPRSTPPEERLLVEQQQQQSRLAAAHGLQRREAFFQFHALRCNPEAPVTLETVPLHAGFASTAIAPSVLESVMDPMGGGGGTGSRAASVGRGGDDASVNTEEGMSMSYSTHSAAPSSYPYLFDAEPRARRSSVSRHRSRHRGRSTSRGGSVSAVSSEADGEDGEAYETNGVSGRSSRATSVASAQSEAEHTAATAGARPTNGSAAASAKATDWRTNAKRSILEQLTLYRRGKHGKPAVLNDDQCREMCQLLLQRAMQAEADRQGVSLAVQSNNLTAPFSKVTEQRLKKSVDHYVERRIQQGTLLSSGTAAMGGREDTGVLGYGAVGVLGTSASAAAGAAGYGGPVPYDAVAEARQRAVADTPVYED